VAITFESIKRTTNVDHISNEIHIYYNPEPQQSFVCTILSELEDLAKNPFSARQNAFLVHHQNVLKQITGTFPISFYLHFRSSK
jgi:hypothetical protein